MADTKESGLQRKPVSVPAAVQHVLKNQSTEQPRYSGGQLPMLMNSRSVRWAIMSRWILRQQSPNKNLTRWELPGDSCDGATP